MSNISYSNRFTMLYTPMIILLLQTYCALSRCDTCTYQYVVFKDHKEMQEETILT